jgi:hypothetical protein
LFSKKEVSDIFPEYYIIKVNKFNDIAKDSLDEWIYFFKNSEVKDEFNAKGLSEAKEILDVMRLNKEEQYGYNRYLDNLHYKASIAMTMNIAAEDKLKIDIIKKMILQGLDNETIFNIIGFDTALIQSIRENPDRENWVLE